MTLNEISVILFGLFAGYWVVSRLILRSPKAPTQTPLASAGTAQQQWHDILQIAPSATAPEIRDAYRHLISKYHPDKVDALGQELKDLAKQKSREITAAFQEGMRARGERQ